MGQPNKALAALIQEANMSLAGLARRVNELGNSSDANLSYDYTAVYRWIRKGERPRGSVPALIAQTLAERLGRQVSLADIGMSTADVVPADLGLTYQDDLDAAITGTVRLWNADLAGVTTIHAASVTAAAWTDATLSWLVRSGPEKLVEREHAPRVGRADIAAIRATIAAFSSLDNDFGGGHARRALVQYLGSDVAQLLSGRYTEQAGRELFATVAEGTLLAAWASYDAGLETLAQRYFIQALRLSQAAGDLLLGGSILDAMSHQATFLGRHREAANLARAARTGTCGQATATLTAHFHAMEARALAAAGDTAGCHRALGEAVRVFERRQPGDDPGWIGYFDDAELSAEFSHCFRDIGRSADAATYAERSLESAGASPRSDFFVTMVLADSYLARGEVEAACDTARRALDIGEQLKSARCVEYLRRFQQRLAPYVKTVPAQELGAYSADHPLWTAAT